MWHGGFSFLTEDVCCNFRVAAQITASFRCFMVRLMVNTLDDGNTGLFASFFSEESLPVRVWRPAVQDVPERLL